VLYQHPSLSECIEYLPIKQFTPQFSGKRINVTRVEQALEEDPRTICVCCPYCLTVFEDVLKDKKADEKVQVLDLAEIVAGALKL
jgi:Fe-S oxidoreductase